jgi:Uma2 family endonuclease
MMLAEQLKNHDDTPTEDRIVVLRGLSWADYERLLKVRGEASVPRFALKKRGLEPDGCYVFGVVAEPKRPDLAIEVVWTRGGVEKLDIYSALGVAEVWFWQRGRIAIHVLEQDSYADATASRVLPGIDLVELASFLDRPTDSQAMRDYRAALRQTP